MAVRIVDFCPITGLVLVDGEDGLDGFVVDGVGVFGFLHVASLMTYPNEAKRSVG